MADVPQGLVSPWKAEIALEQAVASIHELCRSEFQPSKPSKRINLRVAEAVYEVQFQSLFELFVVSAASWWHIQSIRIVFLFPSSQVPVLVLLNLKSEEKSFLQSNRLQRDKWILLLFLDEGMPLNIALSGKCMAIIILSRTCRLIVFEGWTWEWLIYSFIPFIPRPNLIKSPLKRIVTESDPELEAN